MDRAQMRAVIRAHLRDLPVGALAIAALACATTSAPPSSSTPAGGAADATAGAPRSTEPTPLPDQEKALAALAPSWSPGAVPKGVDPAVWPWLEPKDNAMTAERVALGRKLFFDPRLSADGTVACATCHDVTKGFGDAREVSEGIGGQLGKRNAPTVANALFFETQFLDGRAATLEEQATLPIVNPIEMGQPHGDAAVAAIDKDPEYQRMFQAAYGEPPTYAGIGRAIAAFERTLVYLDAPYDRWLAGDPNALDDDAKKGFELFNGKARCVTCHHINGSNPLGSDQRFHNIGVSARQENFEQRAIEALGLLAQDDSAEAIDRLALETDLSALGRFLVTKDRFDIGAFKTSQLRNVGLTAPYMHDGSLATLWDVMDHYDKGGEANPYLDGGIEALALTEPEIDQLVAFMVALTDVRFASDQAAELARQRAVAAKSRPMRDEALAHREVLPFEARVKGKAEPPPKSPAVPSGKAPATTPTPADKPTEENAR
jgi:cytochrome c peroxidase